MTDGPLGRRKHKLPSPLPKNKNKKDFSRMLQKQSGSVLMLKILKKKMYKTMYLPN